MSDSYPRLSQHVQLTALLAAGGLLAAGCTPSAPAPDAEAIRAVRTVTVESAGRRQARTFAGAARAEVESSISFRVAGTISHVHVGVGDHVRTGQPIARLDAVDYELQVQEADAALRQVKALADNAAAALRRAWVLFESDNIAHTDLEAATAAADSASAQVEAAGKRLELVERQMGYTRLVAPIDGVVAAVYATANEHVMPGQPVVVLTTGAAPEVEVAVPEGLIRRIRKDTPVTVRFGAVPGARFRGRVSEVGVAPMATSTLFAVVVRLDDDASAVRPGMAAEVSVPFDSGDSVERLLVPPQSVGEDREGRFVFVAESTGDGLAVARRRAVSVGRFGADGLEIVAGLSTGARVVSAGVSRIADGDVVGLAPATTTLAGLSTADGYVPSLAPAGTTGG